MRKHSVVTDVPAYGSVHASTAMIHPKKFFEAYASDRRREEIPSFDRDAFAHIVRYVARPPQSTGMVMFAKLTPGQESAEIEAQLERFARIGQDFEWKVYGLDRPGDLRERLAARGFVADDEETFMAYPLAKLASRSPRAASGCEVRRIVDVAGIRDVLAVQRDVWNEDFTWLDAQLSERLRAIPETLSIYCAYRAGRPVASGWTDFPAGSNYPELHGGAVVVEARGLGLYAALFDVRLREAARRDYDVVCVDASSMSRPIPEHIGFEVICATVPMQWRSR